MEDADFFEQNDGDTATFTLGDFRAEANQQSFYVLPSDVRTGRVGEDCFECLLMRALHLAMVLNAGTARNTTEHVTPRRSPR